jgi:hypothetical protein
MKSNEQIARDCAHKLGMYPAAMKFILAAIRESQTPDESAKQDSDERKAVDAVLELYSECPLCGNDFESKGHTSTCEIGTAVAARGLSTKASQSATDGGENEEHAETIRAIITAKERASKSRQRFGNEHVGLQAQERWTVVTDDINRPTAKRLETSNRKIICGWCASIAWGLLEELSAAHNATLK